MATGWLYQSLTSGARAGVVAAAGAVASYLNGSDATVGLPAWSEQVPLTAAAELSGPA